ncbi:MAG TPA: S8 family peptidase [Blastocatellia bacterium]|nr:S8 family peptidase [Blastocatellia bacterium]
MKKCLAVCSCLILFSLFLIPRSNVYSQRRDNARQLYADDRIVVKLKATAEAGSDIDALAQDLVRAPGVKGESLSTRRRGEIGLIHLNRNVSVEEALLRAKEDPRVEFAEPDYFVYAMDTVPNDPYFAAGNLWGLSASSCWFCDPGQSSPNVDATKAWDITTGSDDVVAVVLDTGVDLQHEDLAANAWMNPGEIPDNGIDDDGNGFKDDVNGWNFFNDNQQTFISTSEDFHGTHVAGSIGAVGNNGKGVTGVAWHVRIMSLKFLGGPQGRGSTSNAVRGINYAIDMRNRGVNVRVINASWGGGSDSQSLREAIAAANAAGILFVCAAGNGSTNIDEIPDFPGAYAKDIPNTVSVAAVDPGSRLASYSNFGHDSVSLAAPGNQIFSTYPGNIYAQLQGTSMSTPYVSGIAVLVWSREPNLTPAEVKTRLVDTSEPLNDLCSRVSRSGRASAYDALINRIAPPRSPEVLRVSFSKKWLTIDGFGFANGSAVVEADGTPLPAAEYDSAFSLANGTLTRLYIFMGKKPMKRTFPVGTVVGISVFNPGTGERSVQFPTTRF